MLFSFGVHVNNNRITIEKRKSGIRDTLVYAAELLESKVPFEKELPVILETERDPAAVFAAVDRFSETVRNRAAETTASGVKK